MAGEFFITIEGSKQGKFKGDILRGRAANKCRGFDVAYELEVPQDVASGRASGKRRHDPVTVTKEWGAATPQIFQAVVTNEVLKSVVLEFVKLSKETEEIYHTVKLTNANVSHLKWYIGSPPGSEREDRRELEDVSFTFETIDVESKTGKTSASDSTSGA